MKIDPANSIRVNGSAGARDLLKNIDVGAEIPVRISGREGRNFAFLDIGGKRMRAEFTRGVPGNNSLMLKLDRIVNDLYVFKIISPTEMKGYLERMLEFSLLRPHEALQHSPAEMSKILANRTTALYLFHAYAMKLPDQERTRLDTSRILMRIFSLGFSSSALHDLACLLSERGLGNAGAFFLFALLGRDQGNRSKKSPSGLTTFADELESVIEKEPAESRQEIISFLVRELSGQEQSTPLQGIIPVYDDEGLSLACYIKTPDFLVINVELSGLGMLDIFARKEDNSIIIKVCADNELSLKKLEISAPDLTDRLSSTGLKATVSFHNRNFIIDKMVEINSYYSLNSVFDIKV